MATQKPIHTVRHSKRQGNRKNRHVKKTILVGVRILKKDPAENTKHAIEHLLKVAKSPKRKMRLRKAASTMAKLLEHTPRDGHKIINRLVRTNAKTPLEISTITRIFSSPLAFTTLKGKLRDFSNYKIGFGDLMDTVERAYAKQVPQSRMEKVLHCKKGQFYEMIMKTALEYGSPKSLITNTTIKRMHLQGMAKEEIVKADRLRWRIHEISHAMYVAMRSGNKPLEKEARLEIRKIQREFISEFTKKT